MMTNELVTLASAAGLVSLDDPACEAPSLTGNKAATLSLLRRAGFQVPLGVVVSADALGSADDELPAGVRAALSDVPDLVVPGPWAVRSSSTAEDTEQASFAGQFETVAFAALFISLAIVIGALLAFIEPTTTHGAGLGKR